MFCGNVYVSLAKSIGKINSNPCEMRNDVNQNFSGVKFVQKVQNVEVCNFCQFLKFRFLLLSSCTNAFLSPKSSIALSFSFFLRKM